jgi:hypothetical protein
MASFGGGGISVLGGLPLLGFLLSVGLWGCSFGQASWGHKVWVDGVIELFDALAMGRCWLDDPSVKVF